MLRGLCLDGVFVADGGAGTGNAGSRDRGSSPQPEALPHLNTLRIHG